MCASNFGFRKARKARKAGNYVLYAAWKLYRVDVRKILFQVRTRQTASFPTEWLKPPVIPLGLPCWSNARFMIYLFFPDLQTL